MLKILGYAVIGVIFAGSSYVDRYHMEELQKLRMASKSQKTVYQSKEYKVLYRGIHRGHLEEVIDKTLVHLGVKNRDAWTRLLLLTAMTESDCGRLLKQVSGPAKGLMQTEIPTEKDVLRWTQQKYPELYEKVRQLRVPARLEIHEAQYNIAYSIAVAYLEYLHRKVNPVGKTHKQLAEIWKKHYNTYKGKGRVNVAVSKSFDIDNKSPWLMTELK